jgi:hypothetical protein
MNSDEGDIINLIWVATLAKLLVHRGVLTKEEIISEFQSVRAGQTITPALQLEIDGMIRAVTHW